jgi:SAM-dependent methyltransferase
MFETARADHTHRRLTSTYVVEMGDELERNRALWSHVNAQFTAADADARWGQAEITWGLFSVPDAELGVLGEVAGLDILEIGSGTAYFSSWLYRRHARPVALDLSRAQLETARRCQAGSAAGRLAGGDASTNMDTDIGADRRTPACSFPLVEADGSRLPFRDDSFDLAVSEYGASPWCDPERWLPEAARVLRPGGRLVFLTNSALLGLCVPAEGGTAEDRLLRSPGELARITWPGGGTEHHPSHGDWIRHLRAAGFGIDALHELYPPAGAGAHDFYEIVTPEWAERWPAEELWVAHLPSL